MNVLSGMLLCATDKERTKIEVLRPAEGSKPGDRITGEMFTEAPDTQLNPKKKIFEKVQEELTTNGGMKVTYRGELLRTETGPLKAVSLSAARIS